MTMMNCVAAALLGWTAWLAQNGPVQPPVAPPTNPGSVSAPHSPGVQPAQGGGGTASLQPPLLVQHLPDAMTCGAPEWIVPGTRITYFTSVAEIEDAAGAVNLVPDPNGNITDSKGNRFREGTPVTGGVGGAGWDCVDVIAVEDNAIVLVMRQFLNANGLQGPCNTSGTHSFVVHPAGCDYFIHPRLLGQLQESSNNGISLLKGTINHRGATYNAIRSTVEIPNTRLSSMYDLASGVQLTHNSSSLIDKGTAYRASGNQYDPQRKTTRSLANNQFIGVRELEIPWKNMSMPDWVRTMKKARYQGSRVDSGTPEMGLGKLVTYMTVDVSTAYVGKTFSYYTAQITNQMEGMPAMDPITISMASGQASIDGLWMDPNALRQLQQGQVLDGDPNTGVQYGVEYIGPGQNGGQVVVITCGNQMYKFQAMYDLNDGKLLGTNRMEKSPSTGGMLTTQLMLVGME